MFDSDQQYQILKETIVEYRSIISNVSDLEQASNLRQQENRAVTMISLSRFLVIISSLLVLFLFGVVLILFAYMLHTLYIDFHAKIDVKKLLGASFDQIVRPFLFTTAWVL
jgi:cell division protein FtsX